MTLLGVIWAVFAPLLLLLPIGVIYRLIKPAVANIELTRRLPLWQGRLFRLGIAALMVLIPVRVVWYIDKAEFVALCKTEGAPVIRVKASTDGFFLDDSTANSFGQRYLQSEGFQWMEARSIYQRGEFTRYERSLDGTISQLAQKTKSARYEVVTEYLQPLAHTSLTVTRVIDTQAPDGKQEMARSAMAHFNGGRMHAVLGAYGSASYPDLASNQATWNDAYYLVRNTLGAKK